MASTSLNVIRWGMIGCGAVTEIKSGPAYQKTDGFQLHTVMRRDPVLAKDYAARHQVEHYTDNALALIHDDAIDAVYIATPPDSHQEYALKVAAAGKICCIEKPLAPSYEECLTINNTFKKANLPLFVAYYRRSLPRFNKVKSILAEGEIGGIRHISWHLNKPANQLDLAGDKNWRTDKSIALGGYFDDLASHGLDLFAYLLGNYRQVKGIGLNQQGLYSAFDAVSACWAHENGVTGVGSWNFGGCSRQDKVTIYGSKGELHFSVFDEKPVIVESPSGKQSYSIENPENIQLYHVQNMYKQLAHNNQHPSTGTTALHTSWVMNEILKNNID